MLAQEKGLAPLAEIILAKGADEVDAAAPGFVREDAEHPELSVASAQDAVAGAKDIVAERLSQDIEQRAAVKSWYLKTGKLVTKGVGDDAAREKSTYQMYWGLLRAPVHPQEPPRPGRQPRRARGRPWTSPSPWTRRAQPASSRKRPGSTTITTPRPSRTA